VNIGSYPVVETLPGRQVVAKAGEDLGRAIRVDLPRANRIGNDRRAT
jgi:hypothetical protein